MNLLKCFISLCASSLLVACDGDKPAYPSQSKKTYTEATISADGMLLAVLENTGTDQAKLLVRRLDQKTDDWQTLPLPFYTSSARFGLEGQALLLTHDLPENDDMRQLTRWDLADLQKPAQVIYRGPFLAFPAEAKLGEYLVRSCQPKRYPKSEVNSCLERSAFGTYWMLVKDQNTPPVRLTPDGAEPTFSQPSITEQGFFWVTRNIRGDGDYSKEKMGSPALLSFPFPNGSSPVLSDDLIKFSTDVFCDRGNVRCIREYNAGTDPKTLRYVYRLEATLGMQRCSLEDLIGNGGIVSFTPDGQTAVSPQPPTQTLPRRVAVIRFAPHRCEPQSIEQFNIEEQ